MRAFFLLLQKKVTLMVVASLAAAFSTCVANAWPLNAICGSASGLVVSQATLVSTQSYSLCLAGTPSNVNISSSNASWTWQCLGNNGGQTQSCSTVAVSTPACGSANGSSFSKAPSTNLCSRGMPSTVTGSGPWGWACGGVLGYPPVLCSAGNSAPTPAGRSWDFTKTLGINTHMGSSNTHYGSLSQTMADIIFLQKFNGGAHIGFNHMRTSVIYPSLVLFSSLMNITFLMPTTEPNLQNPALNQATLDQFAYAIEGLEGANEPDHIVTVNGLFSSGFVYGGQTGIPAAVAYQQVLYNLVKSDPLLSSIPVYNFSLGNNEANISGNMSAYANISNIHVYPTKGGSPYLSLMPQVSQVNNLPGKPVVISEIGYPTIPPNGNINLNSSIAPALVNEVNEDVQAKYTLSALFDSFNAGFKNIFLYELYDDGGPEINSCDNANTSKEFHFGLFRCDWSPKPLAVALQNLVNILADTNTNAKTFTPKPLAFSLTQTSSDPNMNVNVFNTLLQNAAGTYYLVLWAEPVLWNPTNAKETLVTAPNTVTVTLKTAKTFTVYDPMIGKAPINQVSSATQLALQVYDHPIIVALN